MTTDQQHASGQSGGPWLSLDQFADRATVARFLPLLAERWARQRLHALAKVERRVRTLMTELGLTPGNTGGRA